MCGWQWKTPGWNCSYKIMIEEDRCLRSIRAWTAVFIVGLVLSGVTAFPLVHELHWLLRLVQPLHSPGLMKLAGAGQRGAGPRCGAGTLSGLWDGLARFRPPGDRDGVRRPVARPSAQPLACDVGAAGLCGRASAGVDRGAGARDSALLADDRLQFRGAWVHAAAVGATASR
jgi:hypothetical protein